MKNTNQEIDVPFQQKLAKLMVLTDLLVTEFDNNVLKLEEARSWSGCKARTHY